MNKSELANYRLHNQQIAETTFKTPAEMVGWFGGVQSQDYYGAK